MWVIKWVSFMHEQLCRWYFNRSGPQTRLGKMREKYLEREKRHMIEAMMKKKNVDEKQLEEYFKGIETKKYDEDDMAKIRLEADETYKDIVNKLMAAGHTEEYVSIAVDTMCNVFVCYLATGSGD